MPLTEIQRLQLFSRLRGEEAHPYLHRAKAGLGVRKPQVPLSCSDWLEEKGLGQRLPKALWGSSAAASDCSYLAGFRRSI